VREEGFGSGCPIRDDHVEVLTVTAAGITLSRDGVDAHYVRAAAVPKIFLTAELHHGDFLHDPNLAGANAIAKADSFCNGSIAKPDGQRYKAILADGTNRSAVPAVDWVTKPNTTYYQAAGALALFTANAQGLLRQDHHSGAAVPERTQHLRVPVVGPRHLLHERRRL